MSELISKSKMFGCFFGRIYQNNQRTIYSFTIQIFPRNQDGYSTANNLLVYDIGNIISSKFQANACQCYMIRTYCSLVVQANDQHVIETIYDSLNHIAVEAKLKAGL